MAMEDVVIRGRCGGVGVVGGISWELYRGIMGDVLDCWCMRDVVVHERCGGA